MSDKCTHLIEAFETALWSGKQSDTRLDDGSTNIDSLDAFEYALCTEMNNINAAT